MDFLKISVDIIYLSYNFMISIPLFLSCPRFLSSHARLPAMGGGRLRPSLQPVHSGAAVGAVSRCPDGVQTGDGGSAVLLGHRLWQQHLPERPRLWPTGALPGGDLREPGVCMTNISNICFFFTHRCFIQKRTGATKKCEGPINLFSCIWFEYLS